MACFNEINKITAPSEQHPNAITELIESAHTVAENAEIWRRHYWRRIFATDLRCGDAADVKITAKVGISENSLLELSTSLEIALAPLKSILGAKLSDSDTITDERSIEFTRKLSAKECRGLTFAEWQKTEKITVKTKRSFLAIPLGTRQETVENKLEEFCPDYFDFPALGCCEEDSKKLQKEGFTHVINLIFGNMTSQVPARPISARKIECAAAPGVFFLGQDVPADIFVAHWRKIGLKPTVATGKLGNALQPFQGRQRTQTGNKTVSLVLGFVAGILFSKMANKLGESATRLREAAHEEASGDLATKGRDIFEKARKMANEAAELYEKRQHQSEHGEKERH
jgi:hypothetical protein